MKIKKPGKKQNGDKMGSTLFLKDRSPVQNILKIGEKIKITIAGKPINSRSFEGTDFIRVISP